MPHEKQRLERVSAAEKAEADDARQRMQMGAIRRMQLIAPDEAITFDPSKPCQSCGQALRGKRADAGVACCWYCRQEVA